MAADYKKRINETKLQLYYRNLGDYKAALEQARSYWLNDKATEVCIVEICSGMLYDVAHACFKNGKFIGLSRVYSDGHRYITREQAFEML